ncbi:DVU0298 family protein [Thermodesulfovibrio sp.]|uniref:DVU0298 family protein n=1 Tax=Thermodesulfovibrio sp. TaxID=2067987 RepID=UPI0030958F92
MAKRELPTCLFCGRVIDPPEEKNTDFGVICFGKCLCGAIYVCEPTGHNQGEALADAMFLVSPQGIENIELGTNYELRERDYDLRTHQYVYVKTSRFNGRLFFIKELTGGINPKMHERISINKKDFISLLEKMDFETIEKASLQNHNIFSWLISLSYDRESPISWKAIDAMGHVARAYVLAQKIEPLRNTIRKLLWSMTDESGGIGWRSAELIGEIIMADPALFEDIITILWSQREEESFLESVLRAMIRLSSKINLSDFIKFEDDELERLLENERDDIKALTAILIEKIKSKISVPEGIKDTLLSVYNKGRIMKLKASKAEKFL